ncbi:MAG: hypothetical protein QM778_16835 [Myxococcales bacterium]
MRRLALSWMLAGLFVLGFDRVGATRADAQEPAALSAATTSIIVGAATDPALARVLLTSSTSALQMSSARGPAQPAFEEPDAIELRRSQGWIRGAAPVFAASAAMVLFWATVSRNSDGGEDETGYCGGVLTPMVMAGPLLISGVLTVLGVARKRRLVDEGATAYPMTPGRRALRVIATSVAVTSVVATGMGTAALDALCL